MITGVRLSELAIGSPILGASWEYKELTGVEAVVKRLEDQFYNANYIGFKYVIDTVRPQITSAGRLTMTDNGVHGDIWTFDDRMTEYRRMAQATHISVILEVEFTVQVTETNVDEYIRFIISDLMARYQWVKYWQIGYQPDKVYPNGTYNCDPKLYVYIMRNLYQRAKLISPDIHIGGPGIFQSGAEYLDSRSGWLDVAVGNHFTESSAYTEIGANGFLDYIDFFAFQGRQDTVQLSYSNYTSVVDNLRTMIYEHVGSNTISLFSTLQGHKANQLDNSALKQQAYYDLREIFKALKCGVVPFKNELTDEYPDQNAYNGQFDPNRQDYGITYWYMAQKPAYSTYKFVYDACASFTKVGKDSSVYEENENVDSITFRREEEGAVYDLTVIWPKTYNSVSVILLPGDHLIEYQLENGSRHQLTESTQIDLSETHFIVVYERIELLVVDVDDIRKNITRRLRYQREINDQMMEELPSSFNKEITDTNVYRFMRTVATELADASMTLTMIKEDLYIDTAREDAIYNNFGVLVKLERKSDWTYEKYRRLVKGVMASLMKGPTLQSVVDALQLFTNFKVSIGELYDEKNRVRYSGIAGHLNPRFSFVVDLEKPIEDDSYTQEDLMNDCMYVLKLVKPAHTLGVLQIILAGSENWESYYGDKYGINWHDMDSMDGSMRADFDHVLSEGIFGWKHVDYAGNFYNGITTNMPLLNNGLLVGPRYVLYDRSTTEVESTFDEEHIIENIHEYMTTFLGKDAREEYKKAKARLTELQVDNAEMKFGFYYDKYIQLNGGEDDKRILNQYMLAAKSHLKDEVLTDIDTFFEDMYVFSNTLKTIRFSNDYGISAKFIDQNNVLTEWGEYLKERSFKEKVVVANGTTKVVERLKEEILEPVNEYKEDYDKEEKDNVSYTTYFSEVAMITDDPLSQFTLNITPLNHHKLGPNRREKVNFEEFVTELYDKSTIYLAYAFGMDIRDKYDLPTTDTVTEFNVMNFSCEEYDHFRDKDYLRLNLPENEIHGNSFEGSSLDGNAFEGNSLVDWRGYRNSFTEGFSGYAFNQDIQSPKLLRPFIRKRWEVYSIGAALVEDRYKPKFDILPSFFVDIGKDTYDRDIDDESVDYGNELGERYVLKDDYTNAVRFGLPSFNVRGFYPETATKYKFTEHLTEDRYKPKFDIPSFLGDIGKDTYDRNIDDESVNYGNELYERYVLKDDYTNAVRFGFPFFNVRGFYPETATKYKFTEHLTEDKFAEPTETVSSSPEYNLDEDIDKPEEKLESEVDNFNETFVLYDDEREAIRLGNSKLPINISKFIKYRTAIYRMNPIYREYYDHRWDDSSSFGFSHVLDEDINKPKESLEREVDYLNETFILYDDEREAIRLGNSKLPINASKFIKYRTAIYRMNPIYMEYYDHPIDDSSSWFGFSQILDEKVDKPKELLESEQGFSDTFVLYDDEREAIRLGSSKLSSEASRFIKYRTARVTMNPVYMDYYDQPIVDDFMHIYRESTHEDKLDLNTQINELLESEQGFSETFVLYDDEREAIRFGDRFNKRFIKYVTARCYFNPIVNDYYEHETVDELLSLYREALLTDSFNVPEESSAFTAHLEERYPEPNMPVSASDEGNSSSSSHSAYDVFETGFMKFDTYGFSIDDYYSMYRDVVLKEMILPPVEGNIIFEQCLSETYRIAHYNFILNHAMLNQSSLSFFDFDHIAEFGTTASDTYKRKTIDEMALNFMHRLNDMYDRKIEENTFVDMDNGSVENVNWVYNKEPFHFTKSKLNKHGLSVEQDLMSSFVQSKYIEKVPLPEDVSLVSSNSLVTDKFTTPLESIVGVKQAYSERYHNLNRDVRNRLSFNGFNGTKLNQGRFTVHPNEEHSLSVIVFDKYHPKIVDKEISRKVLLNENKPRKPVGKASAEVERREHYNRITGEKYSKNVIVFDKYQHKITDEELTRNVLFNENMPKPVMEETVGIEAHEHYHIPTNVINPFKFTISSFTKNKFMRKYVIDDPYTDWQHDDKYKGVEETALNTVIGYKEDVSKKLYQAIDNVSREYNYSNNDKYVFNIRETQGFDTECYKTENYEMQSAVAYLKLETNYKGKMIVIRKGTFV